MSYQFVEYGVQDAIARVTISREDKRNALCRQALLEMTEAFSRIHADSGVRAAVLTGKGKTFAAGADLAEVESIRPAEYLEYSSLYTSLYKAVRENAKPVIAAVNGHALGGGNILALSCDLIIASEKAKFSVPEIHLAFFGGAALLPRLVGRHRASELVLLGEMYGAEQALQMGVVNKVVPQEQLLDTALEYARKLAAKAPLALSLAKKSILAGTTYDLGMSTEYQAALVSVLYSSADKKEGFSAFMEKREPKFTGN